MTRQAAATSDLFSRVEAAWPCLIPAHAAARATGGQFDEVFIVDNALVFRFPRTAAAAATLRTEVDLLRALQGRQPLPVPDPEFVRFGSGASDSGFAG